MGYIQSHKKTCTITLKIYCKEDLLHKEHVIGTSAECFIITCNGSDTDYNDDDYISGQVMITSPMSPVVR